MDSPGLIPLVVLAVIALEPPGTGVDIPTGVPGAGDDAKCAVPAGKGDAEPCGDGGWLVGAELTEDDEVRRRL
jgi:hypothetical protein